MANSLKTTEEKAAALKARLGRMKAKASEGPEATSDQIKRILVIWLLFSTGNIDVIDPSQWSTIVSKTKIDEPNQLPPGVTTDMIWNSRDDFSDPLHDANFTFLDFVEDFSSNGTKVVINWGGGTTCPSIDTILSMLP